MAAALNNKVAGDDARDSESSEPRRGSLVLDAKLASEEDAAVLAKMGYSDLKILLVFKLIKCLAVTSKSCGEISV